MGRLAWVLASVLAASFVAPAVASADRRPIGSSVEDAAAHFEQGVTLSRAQDWRGALSAFEQAYAASPSYRVLYDIADCKIRLRDYAGALSAFQQYLLEANAQIAQERRRSVEDAVAALRKRVALVRVTTEPAGAVIRIDDVDVGVSPIPASFVNRGHRKISAAKEGYVGETEYVEIAGEDVAHVALTLSLERRPAPAPVVALPASRSILPAVAFFGVAGAGLGVGLLFGIDAISSKSALDRQCGGSTCPSSSQPLIDDSRRSAVLSTVGFVFALAGAGAGIGYLVLGPSRKAGPSQALFVRPVLGAAFLGAAGAF